jgi:hypothetical protein
MIRLLPNPSEESKSPSSKIVWFLLTVTVSVVLTMAGAWASGVTTDIAGLKDSKTVILERLASIDTKLDDILAQLKQQHEEVRSHRGR